MLLTALSAQPLSESGELLAMNVIFLVGVASFYHVKDHNQLLYFLNSTQFYAR